MKAKGFNTTEVGIVPDDWLVSSCSEFSNPVRGGSPRPAGDPRYFNGNYIPWLTVASLTNISESQLTVSRTETCLTEEGALRSRTLEKGTLIIANSGATLGVAKLLGFRCCANDGIAALLNLKKEISPTYLAYYINTKTKYLREVVATGNGQPNLNTRLIGNIKVPLPPTRAEQDAIANSLRDIDELIESLEQLIFKKCLIKKGAMQELLTARRRLPGFSTSWVEVRLGEIADLYQPQTISAREFTETGFPVYGANGVVGFYPKTNHDSWQVTVTCRGSTCGTVNRTVDRCWITGNAMVIACDQGKIDKQFLFYLLKNTDLSECITGSGQPQIVRKPLAAVKLWLPGDRSEQVEIGNYLSDFDLEVDSLQRQLAKIRLIKQGMMQELLTGRIRLI